MSTKGKIRRSRCFCHLLSILAAGAVLSGVSLGQEKPSQRPEKMAYGVDRANVPDAVARVRSGEFAGIHVDLIARAGAVEAIPSLRQQFERVDDPSLKAKIASALVKLGDKDDIYWDYLVKLATRAVESEAPDFRSPEFERWMKARNLTPAETKEEMYLLPSSMALLAMTGDQRAVPLLRRALLSKNYLTQVFGAMGLAELQDKESIPLIIEACKKAPADDAETIAESLVYFDDQSAQSAVDQYISKERAVIYRDARAHGKKSPLYVPLY